MSVENFIQNVKRYGLQKQVAHGSVHGKTYNNYRMYRLQSMGLTKRLVRRAKTLVNLRNYTF